MSRTLGSGGYQLFCQFVIEPCPHTDAAALLVGPAARQPLAGKRLSVLFQWYSALPETTGPAEPAAWHTAGSLLSEYDGVCPRRD